MHNIRLSHKFVIVINVLTIFLCSRTHRKYCIAIKAAEGITAKLHLSQFADGRFEANVVTTTRAIVSSRSLLTELLSQNPAGSF
jgi:hypothetical protein